MAWMSGTASERGATHGSRSRIIDWRRPGLLLWIGLVSLFGGLLLMLELQLPIRYTWKEPFRVVIQDIFNQPGALVFVAGMYLIGAYGRRGEWDLDQVVKLARTQILHGIDRFWIRVAAGIAVESAQLLVLPGVSVVDSLVAFGAGFFIAGIRWNRRSATETAAFLVLSALVFSTASYASTVLKAASLVRGVEWDYEILALDISLTGLVPHRLAAAWVADHSNIAMILDWVYFKLFDHMIWVTAVLVGLRQFKMRTEFLTAIAIGYLIGGIWYYLMPAWGPIYTDPAAFTYLDAIPVRTPSIRDALKIFTVEVIEGRSQLLRSWVYVAAMPSLHMAFEFIMVWYSRQSPIALLISLALMVLTFLSTLALGWHYAADSIGGAMVAAVSIALASRFRNSLLPSCFRLAEDHPIPPPKPLFKTLWRAWNSAADVRANHS